MKTSWVKARQTKYTAYVTLYVLVVVAVLAAVNFLSNRHATWSYDATSNKLFSLSDQTKKIVGSLDGDVTITLYDQTSRFSAAKDLLDRYDSLSSKVTVRYVDPDKDPQEARAAGIESYGTIFVEAGGKREEAANLTEENVTNALIRALKEGVKTVCAVQGSGEHSFDETGREGYSNFQDVLKSSNYETRTISLLESPEVPSDCSVLLIGGPRFDYVEPVVEPIRKYVEGGGRALILLDPPLRFGQDAIGNNTEMVELLKSWGVVLNDDLVLDPSGVGRFFGLGPEVPLVTSYDAHPIVRDMRDIATAFPLARSVDTESVDGATVSELFSTSSNAVATSELSSTEIEIDREKDKSGPLNLAVAGTIPVKKSDGAADESEEEAPTPAEPEGEAEGRFVVVGSSGWLANNTLRFNGNRDLALNMMNWLSSDEDLISIRPKEPEDRRLTLTSQQMGRVFWSCVVLLPLIIIGAGVSVWWKRR